jgi:hypothetical protein|eukprot:COSAG01_NODE_2189_length_8193_cov_47.570917_1_plen_52_part_00
MVQFKKDSTHVFKPRLNYVWDYELASHHGQSMDFSGLVNYCMAEKTELRHL